MSNIHFKNTSTNIENCTSASSNFSSSEKGLSYLSNLTQENALNSQQLQEALKKRQEEAIIHKIFKENEEEIKNRYFSNGEIFSNLSTNTSTNIENCSSASSNFSSSEKGLSYLSNLSQENVLNSQQLQEALKERQEEIIHKIFIENEEEIKNRYFRNGEIFSNLSTDVKKKIASDFMSSFTTFIMRYAVKYYHNIKVIPFADYIRPMNNKDTIVLGQYAGKTTEQLTVKDYLQLSGENMNLGDDSFLSQSYKEIRNIYLGCIKKHLEKINA